MKQTVAALAIYTAFACGVQAQGCVQFADGAARLQGEYGESVIGRGVMPNGAVVVIFATPDTGTWTLVVVTPDGCSQSPADGSAWVSFDSEPAGTDG